MDSFYASLKANNTQAGSDLRAEITGSIVLFFLRSIWIEYAQELVFSVKSNSASHFDIGRRNVFILFFLSRLVLVEKFITTMLQRDDLVFPIGRGKQQQGRPEVSRLFLAFGLRIRIRSFGPLCKDLLFFSMSNSAECFCWFHKVHDSFEIPFDIHKFLADLKRLRIEIRSCWFN